MGRKWFFIELVWLIAFAATVFASYAAASWAGDNNTPFRPTTLVIGVDLSQSNPLVRDDGFASRVADRVRPMILGMAPRSRVVLRSFGSYDENSKGTLSLDIVIAPKTARAEDISQLVGQAIAGIPNMIRSGRLRAQPDTNIVPFLMNMSRVTNCSEMPTFYVLASDGVEDSQVANLSRRGASLPAPAVAPFPGCEQLQILGIGRGLKSPADTERLIGEWQFWSQRAGFKSFIGLNDW